MFGHRIDPCCFNISLDSWDSLLQSISGCINLKLWACLFLLLIHLQVPLPHHDRLPALPHLHEHGIPEGHEECEDDDDINIKEMHNIVEMTGLMQRSDWTRLRKLWANEPPGYLRRNPPSPSAQTWQSCNSVQHCPGLKLKSSERWRGGQEEFAKDLGHN